MLVQHNSNGAATFIPTGNVDKIIQLPNKGCLVLHKTGEKTFSPTRFEDVLKAYKKASTSKSSG